MTEYVRRVFKNVVFDPRRGFIITFTWDADLVAKIKSSIPGKYRSFDTVTKEWTIFRAGAEDLIDFLHGKDFNVAGSALAILQPIIDKRERRMQPIVLPNLTVEIDLLRTLYEFQGQGVAFNLQNGNTFIGDDQGLGKTCQVIATTHARADGYPVLVICPNHLKFNWLDEYKAWTGIKGAFMSKEIASHPARYLSSGFLKMVVVNYESLKKYFVSDIVKHPQDGIKVILNELAKYFKTVIYDEIHKCSNPKTERWVIANAISEQATHLHGLSGTPINNNLGELHAEMQLIRVLDKIPNPLWKHKDAAGLMELQLHLKATCYYRREKHEVLKDLPDKLRQVIRVQIHNMAEYRKAEEDLFNYLMQYKNKTYAEAEKASSAEFLTRISILKQIAARGKMPDVKGFVDDLMEQGEEQKIVIFHHHKEIGDVVRNHYQGFVSINGSMAAKEKDASVKSFQWAMVEKPEVLAEAGLQEARGIICSMKAADTGITLTASDKVLFVELPWTATTTDQCEDRCHRIGTKNTVNCYYMLAEGTIDEYIFGIIQDKRLLAKNALGADQQVTTSVMAGLWDLFASKIK